jgi:predicted TIM-barrel fold metal-dependent hydrolase
LALARHPQLKVDLAHFGGMENKSGWRDGICELMAAHGGVYADTGDFALITCRESREKFFGGLKRWLHDHPASPLRERLMYGSDFFMNGLFPAYEQFAANWVSCFQQQFPGHWRQLAGGNAAEFLGLRQGAQRRRLEQFVAAHHLTPRWLKQLG